MSAILVALCLGLTFIASRTTYWIFKVFVGFIWWGLAFYWVKLPASTDPSLQTILVMMTIFVGIACMFWAFWMNGKDKDDVENIGKFKIPFINNEERSPAPTFRERNNSYRQRLSDASKGIRRR